MIDRANEALLSFAQASTFLPTRPHIATIHRWRMRGVRGVRLETTLVGGRRFTSKEAIERFFKRIDAVSGDGQTPDSIEATA